MNQQNPMQQIMQQAQQEMLRNGGQGVPEQTLSQMYQSNPAVAQQVRDLLQSGKSPQQLAMEKMQQMGVNPAQFGIPPGLMRR